LLADHPERSVACWMPFEVTGQMGCDLRESDLQQGPDAEECCKIVGLHAKVKTACRLPDDRLPVTEVENSLSPTGIDRKSTISQENA